MTGTDSLASQLRTLALGVAATEARSENQQALLDKTMDLHNDLTDWACNTEHTEAAAEIMELLERYVTQPQIVLAPVVVIPTALSQRAVR